MMTKQAESYRGVVRTTLANLGNTMTHYPINSATVNTNDEGEKTVTDWGEGVETKGVTSGHMAIRGNVVAQGLENTSSRVVLMKDDVTVSEQDRIVISGDSREWRVQEIRKIDPIQDTLIAQRVVLREVEDGQSV